MHGMAAAIGALRWLGCAVPCDDEEAADASIAGLIRLADGLPAIGLDPDGVPKDLLLPLLLAGVPMAPQGTLRWGQEFVAAEPTIHAPRVLDDGVVAVPSADDLSRCPGPALRPLRVPLAERHGIRLQAGPRLAFLVWERRAVLVNAHEVMLGGFVHGPAAGQRHCLAVPAGAAQELIW